MPKSKKRLVTAEDLYAFELLNGVRISPAGQQVVYYLQRVDRKTEKKYSNLWIAPVQDGEARQFTYGDQNDTAPRWSPDGSTIAFLSNRGDKEKPAQVYLIPFGGGEARILTHIKGQINSLAWSPDGKKLLLSVRKTDPETLEREQDEQKKKLGVVSRRYDRVFFKLDGVGYLPRERTHIWLVDVSTGNTRQLTDHQVYDELFPTWSPDGNWIAFTSNRSENPDFNPDLVDLYVMPAAGGEFRKIEAPIGEKIQPSFSPDGKWLAYYGSEGIAKGYQNQSLWVVPVDGSAPARNLTGRYDYHAQAGALYDMGEAENLPPTWSVDSQRLYFPVMHHGSSVLRSISLDGADVQTVVGEGGLVGGYSFDRSQQRLAYFFGTADDPCQVHLKEVQTGNTSLLTRHNHALLNQVELGSIEEVWFKGEAANDLQGWILKPPGFDPSRKYPSILEIHGGPLTQYGKVFMHEFYYLAAHGFVVYFCNPRGGRGYGEAHAQSIWGGKWGTADYADVMSWADYMAAQPYIDVTRMGVTGGSYGGFMTNWIIGHTQRFRAAVTQRCVSNFVSMWGSSDLNWAFQEWLGARQPFFDLEKYWNNSPIKHIGNAKTPTLVIHNEGDLRCPIEQGEQVFVALKSLGVESEMVRFPDEFHGLSRTGRTDRRIARLNAILGWFQKYLAAPTLPTRANGG